MKKTQVIYRVFLFALFLIVFSNCQDDNDFNKIDPNNIEQVKNWYQKYHSHHLEDNLFFKGKINWEDFFVENESVYIPFDVQSKNFQVASENENSIKSLNAYPFLKIMEDNNGSFTENLIVYFDVKNSKQESKIEFIKPKFETPSKEQLIFNQPYQVYDKSNKLIEDTFRNNKKQSKNAFCQTYYLVLITTYDDGSSDYSIIGSMDECEPGKEGTIGAGFDNTLMLTPSNAPLTLTPDNPIMDMIDYFNCFDTTKDATITIYVSQPIPNSSASHDGTFVGHTFVSISQGSNVSVFGFYPATENIAPIFNPSDPSIMGDDSFDPYNVSISTTVSGSTLQQIIDYSVNYNATYNLNSYNCSDFAIQVGNLSGMNLPEANGSWPGGSGSNPGALGQHIRSRSSNNNQIINATGGNAPNTNKGC